MINSYIKFWLMRIELLILMTVTVTFLFININQLDALNFIISLFQASTCFEHTCSSSGGQKLYYTVSGIITLPYRWPSCARDSHL